jgi:hypothetical protein
MNRQEALKIANGNEQAADFIEAFVALCHTLDDIEDKDKPVTDERLIGDFIRFKEALQLNPWASARATTFFPLIVVSFNAWLDANQWEKSEDVAKQRDADVVKGIYHEVVYWVAYLTGGWSHLRKTTSVHREYDHDFNKGRS